MNLVDFTFGAIVGALIASVAGYLYEIVFAPGEPSKTSGGGIAAADRRGPGRGVFGDRVFRVGGSSGSGVFGVFGDRVFRVRGLRALRGPGLPGRGVFRVGGSSGSSGPSGPSGPSGSGVFRVGGSAPPGAKTNRGGSKTTGAGPRIDKTSGGGDCRRTASGVRGLCRLPALFTVTPPFCRSLPYLRPPAPPRRSGKKRYYPTRGIGLVAHTFEKTCIFFLSGGPSGPPFSIPPRLKL